MSTWAVHTVRCRCGVTTEAQLADGLHISRLPEVRERIIAGTFHNVACSGCKEVSVVETKTLYTDFEQFHWVAVAPPWLLGDWATWSEALEKEFHHNMRVAAPPLVRDMADRFRVRLVFGLDALAEKLFAWDAGLDDRVVELMKVRLHAARRDLFPPGTRLRLVGVDRHKWTLTLRLSEARGATTSIETSLDTYLLAESAMDDAPAGVTDVPFGGFDRVFAASLTGLTHRAAHMHVVESMRPFDADESYPLPGYPVSEDSE